MSTPTLQQVLLTIPGFCAQINSFNEIIPGVPATQENLATLFATFKQRPYMSVKATLDVATIIRMTEDDAEDRGILVELCLRMAPGRMFPVGRVRCFSFHAQGLYEAILCAKGAALSITRDGVCTCKVDPLVLKLDKMPLCFDFLVKRAAAA